MISVSGGRFPPAWPQPLPPLRYVQGLRTSYYLTTLLVKEKHEDSSERKNIFPSCDAQFAEAFLVLWEKQQGFLMGRVIAKGLRWDEVTQSQQQLKIPQDQKSFYEKHRTQKKWVSFSRKWFSSEEAEALPTESEVYFPKRSFTNN
ncbi:hypothetical protein IC602_03905 [Virgibacillus halodenitrificans]|uniref:Uncharacterized protein n=1 Tax=Virgibacillus halodenitrificans TaxID=1482 RepID=A0ABR7VII8_VIRHA|nr:hypothetical protein [Virgibacillus halodenitrificans]